MHPLANKEIAPLHLQIHCKSRSCQPIERIVTSKTRSVDCRWMWSCFILSSLVGIAHNDMSMRIQRLTFPCITFWAQIESGDANTFLPDISDPRTHVHSLVDAVE